MKKKSNNPFSKIGKFVKNQYDKIFHNHEDDCTSIHIGSPVSNPLYNMEDMMQYGHVKKWDISNLLSEDVPYYISFDSPHSVMKQFTNNGHHAHIHCSRKNAVGRAEISGNEGAPLLGQHSDQEE